MKRFYTLLASAALVLSAYAAPFGKPVAASTESLRASVASFTKPGDTAEQVKEKASSRMFSAPNRAKEQDGNLVITKTNGVITDVSGVDSKFYERAATGTTYFIQNQTSLVYDFQSGNVEVKEDGNTVYIKDPLTRFTQGSWVKGTKDGNTISIPTWQPLSYNSNYGASICLAWGDAATNLEVSEHSDVITFTIDGNTLTLEGTTSLLTGKGYVIGAYWNDDLTYQGYWDAETVLTYDEGYVAPSTELVELPKGASVEGWYLNSSELLNQDVNVAFVDSDVYVQGISSDFPTSWVKGSINGTTITFDKFQYLGVYASTYDIWMVGADDNGMCDLTAAYDAAAKTITFNEDIYINAAADRLYYLDMIEDAVLSAEAVIFEEPILTEAVATLPYKNTFETAAERDQVVFYDGNHDNKTFAFANDNGTVAARITYNENQNADDYIAFPGFALRAGQKYTVSVSARCQGASYPERFEVVCGTVAKASEYTISVIEPTTVSNTKYSTYSNTEFMVDEDGVYYFAVHGISPADTYYMFIDDFAISENPATIVVLWDNSSLHFLAPHVHYSLDGGVTFEDEAVAMMHLDEAALTEEGEETPTTGNDIWGASIPAAATHVAFSDGGNADDTTKAFEVEDGTLYHATETTGIELIEANTAKAEYFNLQGIRVTNPVAGGIYIVRRGNVITKVIK